MTIEELVRRIRDAYVAELHAFVCQQKERFEKGSGDVKLRLDHRKGPYDRFYCADYVSTRPDQKGTVVELSPSDTFSFGPIEGVIGRTQVRFGEFLWDDVEIDHDLAADLTAPLAPWFEHWFDPGDVRLRASPDGACPVIHALTVTPGRIAVDFGSAEVEAFWELIALLRDAGAESVKIGSNRARAAGSATPSTE
jgi:hypothetical protein